jgi:hypothetical protein
MKYVMNLEYLRIIFIVETQNYIEINDEKIIKYFPSIDFDAHCLQNLKLICVWRKNNNLNQVANFRGELNQNIVIWIFLQNQPALA